VSDLSVAELLERRAAELAGWNEDSMHVTLQLVDGVVRRATVEAMPKAKPAPIGRSELARITRDDDRRPLA
jgi:hypothetical protein